MRKLNNEEVIPGSGLVNLYIFPTTKTLKKTINFEIEKSTNVWKPFRSFNEDSGQTINIKSGEKIRVVYEDADETPQESEVLISD